MARRLRGCGRRYVLVLALVIVPATAAAQSPTAPPHPSMPWGGITTPYGQFIRFVYVPPQPVALEYLVPGTPESPPPAVEPRPADGGEATTGDKPTEEPPRESPPLAPRVVHQQVTVPGYYVRETTVGFHYPERWAIEQVGVGAYRWRMLPAQFVPK